LILSLTSETNAFPSTVKNRVLTQMPPDDFLALKPMLQSVAFKGRTILQEAHRPVEYFHFIEDGLVSQVAGTSNDCVETAMVGVFGYVGLALILGSPVASQRSIGSMPGTALRIQADDLSRVLASRPQIRTHLLRYLPALIAQNTQSVLCAARHEINQRLARWLLLASDRIEGDVLYITHELLSSSLGVRRASVTNALLQFESEGIVKKMRGAVHVIDRPGLESRACDCYTIVRDAYARTQVTHDAHADCAHAHEGEFVAGAA
jgi:CRP-like cAMP-binding protein